MVRPGDRALALRIEEGLTTFDQTRRNLPGIQPLAQRETLLAQIIESARRVRYVSVIKERGVSERHADPNDELFDPLKASVLFHEQGELDEAFWMVFFFVHFGKHSRAGWRYAREVYGYLGKPSHRWDWATTSANPAAFREWLDAHQEQIRIPGVPRGFGNHRKYQSLDAYSNTGTGAAFETYVEWVGPPHTHRELMDQALQKADWNPLRAFRELYNSMNHVASFGRTARFDYLTMIGKLELAAIEPDSAYMQSSTGPLSGARLLFGVHYGAAQLDQWLIELEAQLGVGMQVLEDALCNWQKSPDIFLPFRG